MPIRFEAYRMRDGVTPLSQDYFNPVFGDLDARIDLANDRIQDGFDTLDRARFDFLHVAELGRIEPGFGELAL